MIDYGEVQHERRQGAKTSHEKSLPCVDLGSLSDRSPGPFDGCHFAPPKKFGADYPAFGRRRSFIYLLGIISTRTESRSSRRCFRFPQSTYRRLLVSGW